MVSEQNLPQEELQFSVVPFCGVYQPQQTPNITSNSIPQYTQNHEFCNESNLESDRTPQLLKTMNLLMCIFGKTSLCFHQDGGTGARMEAAGEQALIQMIK